MDIQRATNDSFADIDTILILLLNGVVSTHDFMDIVYSAKGIVSRLYLETAIDSLLGYPEKIDLQIVHFVLDLTLVSNIDPTRIIDLLAKFQLKERFATHIVRINFYDSAFWGKNGGNVLAYCCIHGYIDLVKFILPAIDPNIDGSSAMVQAILYNQVEIVKLLVEDVRFDITYNENFLITHVCECGNTEILQLFLKYPQVDIHAHNNRGFKQAVAQNHPAIIDILTNDPRFNGSPKTPLLTPHHVAMSVLDDDEPNFESLLTEYMYSS
jgi:hypothetical protein